MRAVQESLESSLPRRSFNARAGYPTYQPRYDGGTVIIEDLNWDISVSPPDLDGNLFRIRDCDTAILRNAVIDIPDSAALNEVFRVNNCERVVIENVVITGAVDYYTILLEFVDEVEIRNLAIVAEGPEAGGGVSISWGRYFNGEWTYTGQGRQTAGKSGTALLENIYIRGGTRGSGNRDGIYLLSPQQAVVRNAFVEYFEPFPLGPVRSPGLDAAIDVSHRRDDIADATIIVEDSVFLEAKDVKTSGGVQRTPSSNQITWRNNVFLNARIDPYSAAPVTFTNNLILNTDEISNAIAGEGTHDSQLPHLLYFFRHNDRDLHRFSDNLVFGDGVPFMVARGEQSDAGLRNRNHYLFSGNTLYAVTGFTGDDSVRSLSEAEQSEFEVVVRNLAEDLRGSGSRARLSDLISTWGQ